MTKILLILKNELITVVSRRSFILTLILVPLVPFVIITILNSIGKENAQAVGQIFSGPTNAPTHEGYVDQSGLIKKLPESAPAGRFIAYPSVDQARADLASGKIGGYYLVPADYLVTGKITYIRTDFNPFSGMGQSGNFQFVLQYNLLGQNEKLTQQLNNPLILKTVSLAPTPERDPNSMLTFFVPYIVTMIFYIVILTASGLMLNSVTSEKQNRVMEILLVSVRPIQMLTGKIIALGIAGLLQTVIWSGAGLLLMRTNGSTLSLPPGFQLPTSILVWGGLFFILGYGVYAGLMAGVGALVPNLREASQATTVMIIPLIVPLMFMNTLVNDSNGGLAVGLSLFPLTSPVAMMTRLAAGTVPVWQILLSAAILAFTALLTIRAVAGMFRAQTLLTGNSFSLRNFVLALAGKGS
ncbi:MAG: ABC transporter permease [Anaerolineaceae bacterium]|nr:ABC transporter permease [Anaerolineaceae bacterium]